MKSKKTIRRLPAQARKLVKLQRELFSLQRRMGAIIEEIAYVEIERDSLEKSIEKYVAAGDTLQEGELRKLAAHSPAPDCVCGD